MRPGEGACQDDALADPAHKLHRHAVQLLAPDPLAAGS